MNINYNWQSHPENPLIEPILPEWLVGDPTVLPPEDSPDGKWHMFLNTILFIYHYTSTDGILWKRKRCITRGIRAFLFKDENEYFLFYEKVLFPGHSRIVVKFSKDLRKWSKSIKILSAKLKWEREIVHSMSCPCVVKDGNLYRLYYSTSLVFLPDLGFGEPKYIGVAESKNIVGPYKKRIEPIICPSKDHPYRNLGAGAIKVYRDNENNRWIGFNNGIYKDESGKSRSAIMIMVSNDGINWEEPFKEPIIKPTRGWKRALVYQLCAVPRPNGELWIYYNARDGWRFGVERIGLEIGKPVTEAEGNS